MILTGDLGISDVPVLIAAAAHPTLLREKSSGSESVAEMTDMGPDRIIPAESFVSTDPRGAVRLRTGDSSPDNYKPVSVPTLLR